MGTSKRIGVRTLFGALLVSALGLVTPAQAAWQGLSSPGQSSLALGVRPSELALASQARLLAVGTDDPTGVKLIDPDTGTVTGSITLAKKPLSLALDAAATRLYVLQEDISSVAVYDVATRTLAATWSVGGTPVALAFRPNSAELVVLDFAGKRIVALNASTGAVARQQALTVKPEKLFVNAAGTRVMIGTNDGKLLTLDGASWNTVSTVNLSDSIRSVTYWESQSVAIVIQKQLDAVALVNIETGAIVARIAIDTDPDRGAIDNSSSKAYVTTRDDLGVNRIDLATRTSEGRYILPTEASAIVFDPAAQVLYVAQPRDKALIRLDPAQNFLIGSLTLNKRLRDITVDNATHQAAAIAEKTDELSRIRLADRFFDTLALPAKPSKIGMDSARNLAVIAFKSDLRFANLGSSPATLYAETIDAGDDINALAVDSSRGVTLVTTKGNTPLTVIDNATRTKVASIASTEKLGALGIDVQRGLAYIVTDSRKLLIFDIASRGFTATATLAFRPDAIAIDPALRVAVLIDGDGDKAQILDLATLQIVQALALPRHPGAVDIQADTHIAVVVSKESDQVSLVNLVTNAVTAGYASVETPFALAVSVRYNEALVLSGEKDEVTIVPLPNALPQLTSIVPALVAAGSAGFVITANGAHFVDRSKIIFGTTELVTRWLSASQLEADLPASLVAVAGTVNVLVRTPAPGGGDSSTLPFVIATPPPVLASLAPANVAADSQAKAFTLGGQNFPAGATVIFGVQSVLPSSVTPSQIVVQAPGSLFGAPGTLAVKVRSPDGQESGTFSITINPMPEIASVSPNTLVIDGQTRTFTLAGSGFQTGAVVVANGGSNLAAASVTPGQITVSVPGTFLSSPGSLALAVRNPDGGLSASVTVSLTAPTAPFLYSELPSSVMAGSPATELVLSGASFTSGAVVRAGTTTLTALFVNGQQLRVTIPAALLAQAGELPLVVVNPGSIIEGARTSNIATLSITPAVALQIQGIVPATGQAGDAIIVFGQGFASVASGNQVTFAGANGRLAASISSATGTQLNVVAPAGVVTGPVQVIVNGTTVTGPIFTVAAPNDQEFALIGGPSQLRLVPGGRTSFEIRLGANATAFTGLVKLAVSGLPTSVTARFQPGFVSASQVSTLELTAAATATPTTANLTIQGVNQSTLEAPSITASASLEILAAGQTGVSGRFVDPKGSGIAGVRVRNEEKQTVTDAAGTFLLLGLATGDIALRMDATPANPLYPIWPVNVKVEAGKVANLPDWTINPPPDDAKFTAINNATQDQQITDSRYPGLAISLPAGVTITGWDGVKKTRIAIERLDPDRLPVQSPPLPSRSSYQLYFGTPMGGIPSAPIPFTLPNDLGLEPGDKAELLYFDGSPMGGDGQWKSAGNGTVSADGLTIVTDPGSGVPRFCGVCGLVSFCNPNPPPPPPPPCPEGTCCASDGGGSGDGPGGPPSSGGKPVTLATGQERMSVTDFAIGGRRPISLMRWFNPHDPFNNIGGTTASFGLGWISEYDVALLPFDGPQKRLSLPDNPRVNFESDGAGSYLNKSDIRFRGAKMIQAATDTWEIRFQDGRTWRFRPYPGVTGNLRGGPPFFLAEIQDASGDSLFVTRSTNGRLTALGTQQRQLNATLNAAGLIDKVVDPLGRETKYAYNGQRRLESVTYPDGEVERYSYADDSEFSIPAICQAQGTVSVSLAPVVSKAGGGVRLKTIQKPGETPTTNFHGPSWRVLRQVAPDGAETSFSYSVSGACVVHRDTPTQRCTQSCPSEDNWENWQAGWYVLGGEIIATTVRDPRGLSSVQRFNQSGLGIETTDSQGQRILYTRDPITQRITSSTDALGRTTRFQYDAEGRIAKKIDALNRIVDYTYDSKWKKPAQISRYLADGTTITTSNSYDPFTGKMRSITDPMGQITQFDYTPSGQLQTVTDPMGNTARFEYNEAGDLIKTTDQLGRATVIDRDGAGRLIAGTDPEGGTSIVKYNGLDLVTEIIDAKQGKKSFEYDVTRNLAAITNQKTIVLEQREYDLHHRLVSKKDPLLKAESREYDGNGNLVSIRDRKSQVTRFSYDEQNRLKSVEYADGSLQRLAYDALGRLTSLHEGGGPSGETSITYEYDVVDRPTRIKTVTGSTSYENGYVYDNLDRVSRRELISSGSSDVTTYKHDKSGRIVSIGYGGKEVRFDYDPKGQITAKTLPNGLKQKYLHDPAGQVTEISIEGGGGELIERIGYGYDGRGRRTLQQVVAVRPDIGESSVAATFDNANRLATITFNPGTSTAESFALTYDDNGNLIRKEGTGAAAGKLTLFTWDARDRLISLRTQGVTPAVVADYNYDANGRRTQITMNGRSTSFQYDGLQAVREIGPGGTSAFLLSGTFLDDAIARYSGTENLIFLTDALGSVIAATREDQSFKMSYSYSPFGNVASTAGTIDPTNLFTGRERDESGLYFYRARYYDSSIARFISEDPLGWGGGDNFYAYVANNPLGFVDPLGLFAYCLLLDQKCDSVRTDKAGPNGVFDVYTCVRRRCLWRCYNDSCGNCPDIPCRVKRCPLDHGIEILKYFGPDPTKPMGAAPLCSDVNPAGGG